MVGQVLSDTGGFDYGLYSVFPQVIPGADAGEHQYLGRPDGAGAEDNLPGLDEEGLVVGDRLDARRPGAFPGGVEEYSLDHHVCPDGQVEPVAREAQVAYGSGPTDAVGIVQGNGPHSGAAGRVVVFAVRVSIVLPGLEPGRVPRLPVLLLEAVADNGAAGAMEVTGIVLVGGVGLDHIEVGHQLLEVPLVVSPLRPIVVVLGNAAEEDLSVDGAGSAGHLAPGDFDIGLVGGPGGVLPVVVAVPDSLLVDM